MREGRAGVRAGFVFGRDGWDRCTAPLGLVMGLFGGRMAGTGTGLVPGWEEPPGIEGELLPGISGSGLTSLGTTVTLCLPMLAVDREFKKFWWKPRLRMNGRAVGVTDSLSSLVSSTGEEVWAVNLCLEEAVEKDDGWGLVGEIFSVDSSMTVVLELVLVRNDLRGWNRFDLRGAFVTLTSFTLCCFGSSSGSVWTSFLEVNKEGLVTITEAAVVAIEVSIFLSTVFERVGNCGLLNLLLKREFLLLELVSSLVVDTEDFTVTTSSSNGSESISFLSRIIVLGLFLLLNSGFLDLEVFPSGNLTGEETAGSGRWMGGAGCNMTGSGRPGCITVGASV